tara:strand:+ start:218 stop:418 length:201 start_codon:yes stop_codon:yes gene_type:complete
VKPGDLVQPNFQSEFAASGGSVSQLGLVLSYPEVKNHGTTCVKVSWLGWDLEEYYSVHHLVVVNEA